jgi:anti-anti-sigma factor
MKVLRISQEELLVIFESNPTTASTQDWIGHFSSELTGHEKVARVDLTRLDILSSLGVNVVVGIFQRMEKQNGTILVEVASEKTKRVFDLFKLTELFEVVVVKK